MIDQPRMPGLQFLHSPGPSPVPLAVLQAMGRQPMDMADPRLEACIDRIESGLRHLLHSRAAEVFVYATNGHGAREAVIANLVAPGSRVLVPGTGHFSNGWAEQTEALGGVVLHTPWIEGQPIDAAAVAEQLRADSAHAIEAVFMVHTDTASSVSSDIAAVRAALDAARHPALLVVDAVASLGATPLHMDDWGVDVVLGASQKGLMCPPGLGFTVANARALAHAARNPQPRFYWDWRTRVGAPSYRKFCGTPPQNLLFGLEAALDLWFAEGEAAVLARHRRLAAAVHAAVACWSRAGALDFYARDPGARSEAVTAIATAPGIDPEAIRHCARERFQVALAGGLGPLAGRVFRIGHLGDVNAPMVLGCLAGVEAALRVQRVPIGSGALEAAIAVLAQD